MADTVYEFSSQIPLSELTRLFAQVEWAAKHRPDAIQTMLDNTRVYLAAWDGDRLIGFARAVTDDVFRAFVEDVIVDEAYRGQGIGAEITRRLLARLEHVEEVTLACEDHLVPFYARFGFEPFGMNHMHIWRGG